MKKIICLLITVLLGSLTFAQKDRFYFEASERLINVDDTIELNAFADNIEDGTLKWKIGGEEGKDWKYIKGYTATDNPIKVTFKKLGPTNVAISAKRIKKATKKVNGKEVIEEIKESLKFDKKGFLLVTEKGEYSELNQLFAEGTLDSYVKLVKKASKLTENEKYSKDPFVFIWLSRGLYAVSMNLEPSEAVGKYEPYKNAFNDAISALSKAMKLDNNGFLEVSKFSDFINEMQNKYFVEVLGEQTDVDPEKIDYSKISGALGKYAKITKNPICIKYYQIACMFRLNDANAKTVLKEADLQLAQLGDSAVFSETDKLFFANGIVELGKFYAIKKQSNNICGLLKKAIFAVPSLMEEQDRYESFREMNDSTECPE
jgi:hypothetical protein